MPNRLKILETALRLLGPRSAEFYTFEQREAIINTFFDILGDTYASFRSNTCDAMHCDRRAEWMHLTASGIIFTCNYEPLPDESIFDQHLGSLDARWRFLIDTESIKDS